MFNQDIKKNAVKLTISFESVFNSIFKTILLRLFMILDDLEFKLGGSVLVQDEVEKDSKIGGIGKEVNELVNFDCLKHRETIVNLMSD